MIQTIILLIIIAIVAFIKSRPEQKKLIKFNNSQLIETKPQYTSIKNRVIKRGLSHTFRFKY